MTTLCEPTAMNTKFFGQQILKKMAKKGLLTQENQVLLSEEEKNSDKNIVELILSHQFMSEQEILSFWGKSLAALRSILIRF